MSSQPNQPQPKRRQPIRRRPRARALTQLQREVRQLKVKTARTQKQRYIKIGTNEPVQLPVDPLNANDIRYHIDQDNLRLLVRQIARKISAGAGDVTVQNQHVSVDLHFLLHTNEYPYNPIQVPLSGQSQI